MANDLSVGNKERKVSTGIAGLDFVLSGGYPANHLYLVEGNPGTGKTTMALQYLLEGRRLGEPVLYVTLSETKEELCGVAASHGWSLDGMNLFELGALEERLQADEQYTVFHPAEVELGETTKRICEEVDRIQPARIVFDSLSEMRLLAREPLRYRRQVLALKQFFAGRKCTVLLLDDRTAQQTDLQLQSICHGVLALERISVEYGGARRRLIVDKMRGLRFLEGYHDFGIQPGGIVVYPRMVASQNKKECNEEPPRAFAKSGIAELDSLLGGGVHYGTSTLVMGPAGSGKSTLATQYGLQLAQTGQRVACYVFEETRENFLERARGLGMDLREELDTGRLTIEQIDPAEMSPGEFAQKVREAVEIRKASVVLIDSLNGYLNAMPSETFLLIQMHEMLTYLNMRGVMTMMTLAQHGLLGSTMSSPVDLTYLADTVIVLRYFEAFGKVMQALAVIKKRTGGHEHTIRQFHLTSRGIQIGDPLKDFEGVLTGAPVFRGIARRSLRDRKLEDGGLRIASEDRVLILAPTGRDAALIARMLGKEKLFCHDCGTVDEMALELGKGAGIAVFAEEALIGITLQPLLAALRQQPPWSDFPLIFLTSTGSEASETSVRLLELFEPEANITLLERPIRVATLLSSVRSALRARRRQYEVRNYLEERKRSDEKLLRTQKLESLGVLAGGVAHDFNNLLTGILGNASLAVDNLPRGCESLQSVLDDIVTASERAADLTKQLLAYAGKGRFVIAPLNLSSLVRDTSHLVRSTLPKNVELHLELSDDLPCVEADATQMQQVVMNLLINAAEAIPEGLTGDVIALTAVKEIDEKGARQTFTAGEVTPGRYVVLEVHDTGAGMDEATRELIFDPFFTTKFTGRGLGLAAVLGIVQGHKGALKVQSTPGQGSTFQVLFPVADAACPAPAVKPAIAPAAKRGQTILVIDDEPTVRRTAKTTLERGGYDTILAENGTEGVDIFRALEGKIAAVLLDLTMPGMNGEEVLRYLKEIRGDVKVILSSGFSEVEVIPKFSGKGLAAFIQKPYTASALTARVAEVLRAV